MKFTVLSFIALLSIASCTDTNSNSDISKRIPLGTDEWNNNVILVRDIAEMPAAPKVVKIKGRPSPNPDATTPDPPTKADGGLSPRQGAALLPICKPENPPPCGFGDIIGFCAPPGQPCVTACCGGTCAKSSGNEEGLCT